MAARGILAIAFVFLMLPLAGCIGGDDVPETTGPSTIGEKEIASGRPTESFGFKVPAFEATGKVLKESRPNPRNGPGGELQDQLFGERPPSWRINVTVENLVDLGTGEEGKSVGEAWYHLWVGVPDEEAEGGIAWEPAGTDPDPGFEGKLELKTDWESDYDRFTAARLTIETRNDNVMEFPIMEFTAMPEDETGEWALTTVDTFEGAFGDARVAAGSTDTEVNITISAFGLPTTDWGAYDVFLRNLNGDTYLGSLETDPTSAGLVLSLKLTEKDLEGNWQIFVSLESAAEDAKQKAAGFTVLKATF